jgi:hypothetical protein
MKMKLALLGLALSLGMAAPSVAADYDRNHDRDYRDNSRRGSDQRDYQEARWRPAAWQVIGTRTVSYRGERDLIPAYGKARYSQIKLCIYGEPVRMFDLDVRFRNGVRQDVRVRNVIGEGQCTRDIDLNGRQRDITAIGLAYKAIDNERRRNGRRDRDRGAVVKVFAR